jgi:hypothetical protein
LKTTHRHLIELQLGVNALFRPLFSGVGAVRLCCFLLDGTCGAPHGKCISTPVIKLEPVVVAWSLMIRTGWLTPPTTPLPRTNNTGTQAHSWTGLAGFLYLKMSIGSAASISLSRDIRLDTFLRAERFISVLHFR